MCWSPTPQRLALWPATAHQENIRLTRRWFQRAADLGHADAQAFLENIPSIGSRAIEILSTDQLYEQGQDAYQDGAPAEAARLWTQAANQGHGAAMTDLGRLYANGEGVPKDPAAAADWLLKALRHGDVDALEQLRRDAAVWPLATRRALVRALWHAGVYGGASNGQVDAEVLAAIEAVFGKGG